MPGLWWVSFLFGVMTGLGCSPVDSEPGNQTGLADATWVRIQNVSTSDFENIIVGEHDYGALSAGAFSEYADLGVAYTYNYVELTADGAEFVIQPIDYVGETPLGVGYFTYQVDITDFDARALSISASEDQAE